MAENEKEKEVLCRGKHVMRRHIANDCDYICDSCNRDIRLGAPLWSCRPCDFDRCEACVSIRVVAKDDGKSCLSYPFDINVEMSTGETIPRQENRFKPDPTNLRQKGQTQQTDFLAMASSKNLPAWAALTKVCYRVALQDDWENRQKIGLCIEHGRIICAELKVIDGEEWLIDASVPDNDAQNNIFALPLRMEKTKEPVWAIMEGRDGGPPPIDTIPDGVVVAKQPPDGYSKAFPPGAAPGGSWEDAARCGPLPCCWVCLYAIGRGRAIDMEIIYVDKAGKRFREDGEPFDIPKQQEMK